MEQTWGFAVMLISLAATGYVYHSPNVKLKCVAWRIHPFVPASIWLALLFILLLIGSIKPVHDIGLLLSIEASFLSLGFWMVHGLTRSLNPDNSWRIN